MEVLKIEEDSRLSGGIEQNILSLNDLSSAGKSRFMELFDVEPDLSVLKNNSFNNVPSTTVSVPHYNQLQQSLNISTQPSLSIKTDLGEDSTTNSTTPLNFSASSRLTRQSSIKSVLKKITRPRNVERSQSEQITITSSSVRLSLDITSSFQGLIRRQSTTSSTKRNSLATTSPGNIVVQDLRPLLRKTPPSRFKKGEEHLPVEKTSLSQPTQDASRESWRRTSFSGQSSSADELNPSTLLSPLPPYTDSSPPTQISFNSEPRKRTDSVRKWLNSLTSTKRDSSQDSSSSNSSGRRSFKSEKRLELNRTSSFEVVGRPMMAPRSQTAPVVVQSLVEVGEVVGLIPVEESLEPTLIINDAKVSNSQLSIPFPTSTSTPNGSSPNTPPRSRIPSSSRRSSIDFTKVELSSTPRARSTSSLLSMSRPVTPIKSTTSTSISPPSTFTTITASKIIILGQASSHSTTNRLDSPPLLPLRARELYIANKKSTFNPASNSSSSTENDPTFIRGSSSLLLDSPLSHQNDSSSSYFSSREKRGRKHSIPIPTSPSLTNANLLATYLSEGPRLNYRRDAGSEEISLPSSSSHSHSQSSNSDGEEDLELEGKVVENMLEDVIKVW